MDRPVSYDEDFLAWSEQQAAALRELAGRRGLPNALDLEHVAEEIEDLGRAEFNAVKSHIRQILAHLIKAASEPAAAPAAHWRKEVVTFHSALLDGFSPSMEQKLDLDLLWRRAIKQAEAALEDEGRMLVPGLPRNCPFSAEALLSESFDFHEALEKLRALLASSGPARL